MVPVEGAQHAVAVPARVAGAARALALVVDLVAVTASAGAAMVHVATGSAIGDLVRGGIGIQVSSTTVSGAAGAGWRPRSRDCPILRSRTT